MARVELFARTEIGCVRERNEDAFVVANIATGERGLRPGTTVQELGIGVTLVGVCDGMGGAAAGDLASKIGAETLYDTMMAATPLGDHPSAREAMLNAVAAANRAILDYARAHPGKRGMGTTLTAALIYGHELYLCHVGDSRGYLRRGRALTQLTTDHSVVGQMIASGQLTAEQGRSYEHRNVLLQALGVQPVIQPELVHVSLRAGDVLLMCSDGLTGPLEDSRVLELMLKYQDPVRCCRSLTEAACAAGGPDNVTVAVARFVGEGLPIPQGREPVSPDRASHTIQ
ncbi:Protein serine/threonine phosphatase PrpC, regulation of stationary phase [Enhygromyxa salina]|uniref:Protein serine/threonine phosphatase PrpC, regulation of stationary phase n=1 Tax=Enhygromyxa salina TaxID=215803 RepID=A0A0C2CXH4_9BACT|nr:protein phosphatase 2C domain-containing protein [Enhygromyxa salina]KIG12537.1 Protein serine/threonine phosphatase PrpC, regulation of stationary phase [Enhygromyxa salina]